MIIIKSQDEKIITECSTINLKNTISKNTLILGASENVEDWILGTYSSEERALEVMKEIENFICELYADKVIMSHMSIEVFSPPAYELLDRLAKVSKENAIYTMPKQ